MKKCHWCLSKIGRLIKNDTHVIFLLNEFQMNNSTNEVAALLEPYFLFPELAAALALTIISLVIFALFASALFRVGFLFPRVVSVVLLIITLYLGATLAVTSCYQIFEISSYDAVSNREG